MNILVGLISIDVSTFSYTQLNYFNILGTLGLS